MSPEDHEPIVCRWYRAAAAQPASRRPARRATYRRSLGIEVLEDRRLLSLPATTASVSNPLDDPSLVAHVHTHDHEHEHDHGPATTSHLDGVTVFPVQTNETDLPTGAGIEGPDLAIDFLKFVNGHGIETTTPVVGQRIYARAEMRVSGLEPLDSFVVHFVLNDVLVESLPIQGLVGTNVIYWVWQGGWLATPGTHTLTATLDGANAIAEIDETNNTLSLEFTPVEPALAEKFVWPVSGTQSVDWVVSGYLDADPRPGVDNHADYLGRGFTYDGHNGVDVLIPHFAAMDAGQPVLAAASGTVLQAVDGHFDRWLQWQTPAPPVNYVIIDHGNGWHTRYLHLREGSVAVAAGDTVVAGQQIGLIGSSGLSALAHLHFEIRREFAAVEPFVAPADYFVNPPLDTLAAPRALLDYGITNDPPPFHHIAERVSDSDVFPITTEGIPTYSWAIFASPHVGDTWEVRYYDPEGDLYAAFPPEVIEVEQAWQWYWWNTWLPESPAFGKWRADWYINDTLVGSQLFQVGGEEPEIRILRAGALEIYGGVYDELIIDGRTTPVDFGSVLLGALEPIIEFTVENHGYADLLIHGVDLPPGFAMVEPLSAVIPAGATDTFAVRLDDSATGLRAGQILIHSNDISEPASAFAVRGLVINPLQGDYNLNGLVDAADYTIWRDAAGGTVARYSSADANGDGIVNMTDYHLWKNNFGSSLSPESTGVAAVAPAAPAVPPGADRSLAPAREDAPRIAPSAEAPAGNLPFVEVVARDRPLAAPMATRPLYSPVRSTALLAVIAARASAPPAHFDRVLSAVAAVQLQSPRANSPADAADEVFASLAHESDLRLRHPRAASANAST